MTAKLKARQIVSGWPRGRSSSRPIRIPTWFQFAFYKSLMDKRSSPIFGPSDADFEQFTRTNIILFFEAEEEAKYRTEQDRMTEDYRRDQRTRLELYGTSEPSKAMPLLQTIVEVQRDYLKIEWGDEYREPWLVKLQDAEDEHGARLLYEEEMRRKP
jgi:hypothetical protein